MLVDLQKIYIENKGYAFVIWKDTFHACHQRSTELCFEVPINVPSVCPLVNVRL